MLYINNQYTSVVQCPQCGSTCHKIITPLTKEHTIECKVCGYQEIDTIGNRQNFKGYGSLVTDSITILFHEPLTFEKEKEILASISDNPKANFIKWTDEHQLTVLKGSLPSDLSEEEISEIIAEQDYYRSLGCHICNDDCLF